MNVDFGPHMSYRGRIFIKFVGPILVAIKQWHTLDDEWKDIIDTLFRKI